MIFAWVIPSPFHLLRFPVQLFALFFLIERVCECARATTWRIVIWYAALSILFALAFHAFSEFIKQPVEWNAPSD